MTCCDHREDLNGLYAQHCGAFEDDRQGIKRLSPVDCWMAIFLNKIALPHQLNLVGLFWIGLLRNSKTKAKGSTLTWTLREQKHIIF